MLALSNVDVDDDVECCVFVNQNPISYNDGDLTAQQQTAERREWTRIIFVYFNE